MTRTEWQVNIYDRGSITSIDINFNSLGAILSGPGAILSLKHDIILNISVVNAGAQNMLLLLAGWQYLMKSCGW